MVILKPSKNGVPLIIPAINSPSNTDDDTSEAENNENIVSDCNVPDLKIFDELPATPRIHIFRSRKQSESPENPAFDWFCESSAKFSTNCEHVVNGPGKRRHRDSLSFSSEAPPTPTICNVVKRKKCKHKKHRRSRHGRHSNSNNNNNDNSKRRRKKEKLLESPSTEDLFKPRKLSKKEQRAWKKKHGRDEKQAKKLHKAHKKSKITLNINSESDEKQEENEVLENSRRIEEEALDDNQKYNNNNTILRRRRHQRSSKRRSKGNSHSAICDNRDKVQITNWAGSAANNFDDMMKVLKQLHKAIAGLDDPAKLQQVVDIVENSGKDLWSTDSGVTFDFDLCKLSWNTVNKLKEAILV